eukprot:SAG31_NODE_781_length_12127_cov_34.178334_3_plen_67_part_00
MSLKVAQQVSAGTERTQQCCLPLCCTCRYDTVQEEAVKGWLVAKALITLDYTDSLHSVMDIPPFNM